VLRQNRFRNLLSFLFVATLASLTARAQNDQRTVYERYAPIDLTGNWVSVVTEDWAQRMLPPVKGDYSSLPLNPAAQKAANGWDPAKDLAASDTCKGYGAPGLLRIPGRLKIAWQEKGQALRIETDAGQQTRLLQFAGVDGSNAEPSLQGVSIAAWEYAGGFDPARVTPLTNGLAADAARRRGRGAPPSTPQGGALKVVTNRLKPGYLRKNGVPYSKNAVLTEYFNVHADPYGTDWLVVTTRVHDPAYLVVDYITSTNFKREQNAAGWRPQPCSVQ